jgi:hypothetical protein
VDRHNRNGKRDESKQIWNLCGRILYYRISLTSGGSEGGFGWEGKITSGTGDWGQVGRSSIFLLADEISEASWFQIILIRYIKLGVGRIIWNEGELAHGDTGSREFRSEGG